MPRVIRRYKPPAGAAVTRPSDALECCHCKTITWVWADADSASCRGCALKFFNRAGVWVLRGELKYSRKDPDPEE